MKLKVTSKREVNSGIGKRKQRGKDKCTKQGHEKTGQSCRFGLFHRLHLTFLVIRSSVPTTERIKCHLMCNNSSNLEH